MRCDLSYNVSLSVFMAFRNTANEDSSHCSPHLFHSCQPTLKLGQILPCRLVALPAPRDESTGVETNSFQTPAPTLLPKKDLHNRKNHLFVWILRIYNLSKLHRILQLVDFRTFLGHHLDSTSFYKKNHFYTLMKTPSKPVRLSPLYSGRP